MILLRLENYLMLKLFKNLIILNMLCLLCLSMPFKIIFIIDIITWVYSCMSNNQRNLDEYSAITNILSLFLSFIYPFGSSFILFLVAALIKEK